MPDHPATANDDTALAAAPDARPDFSPLALSHLHNSCLALRQLIRQWVGKQSSTRMQAVQVSLADIHHTLQLLDRQGAALVASELRLLANAMANNAVDDIDSCAHTLVLGGEKLTDYIAYLRKPGSVDNALPLVPLLNSCRACRGEPFLSEVLLLAGGLNLPDASSLALPGELDALSFVQSARSAHQPLVRGMLDWFRNKGESAEYLRLIASELSQLSSACDNNTRLQALVPLFDCAEVVCLSVDSADLDNSAAVHRLFAQLERLLKRYMGADLGDPAVYADPLQDALLANLLYYVTQSSLDSSKAAILRRRFKLDRFVVRPNASDRQNHTFDGAGDRVSDALRGSLDVEMGTVRQWLLQAAQGSGHPQAKLLRSRLRQLEPALLIFGAAQSLQHLRFLNNSMEAAADDDQSAASGSELFAETLVRLEHSLDMELGPQLQSSESVQEIAPQDITRACLVEAKRWLLDTEQMILTMFPSALEKPPPGLSASSARQVNKRLAVVDSALQILPLPEVTPLIRGVQSFIDASEGMEFSPTHQRHLATVMVSLGLYLDSVLQRDGAAGQFLTDADNALVQLEQHPEHLAGSSEHEPHDDTLELSADSPTPDHFIPVALDHLSLINQCLSSLSIDTRVTEESAAALRELQGAHRQLMLSADDALATDIRDLAEANAALLQKMDGDTPDAHMLELLHETAAVLPQLINQLQSPSDKVQDLPQLVGKIKALGEDRPDAEHTNASTIALPAQHVPAEHQSFTLDNTLAQVFYKECRQHLGVLQSLVEDALASGRMAFDADATPDAVLNTSAALPGKSMLRALHTLTGSAQTVGATSIIEVAQPLQKAALSKQRAGARFDRPETEYIRDVVAALCTHVNALESGERDDGDAGVELEQLLAFADRAEPFIPERQAGLHISDAVNSLDTVFEAEARELLEHLRDSASELDQTETAEEAVARMLVSLHTLKGSARMAGRSELATRAHEFEDELKQLDPIAPGSVVHDALADLQRLMLVDQPGDTPPKPAAPEAPVSSGASQVLALATRATVSQAALGESLRRLHDACTDLESTVNRLQRLPREQAELGSAAVNEMLSDLDGIRRNIADALLDAETEQQQGSRASSAVQQSLIRAQLVKFGDCEERMQRALADASEQTGKQCVLQLLGSDLTMDKSLFRQILNPLEHLVRNAVVHGVETTGDRLANGKTSAGTVTVQAEIDGTDLLVSVSDDGAGIDTAMVNRIRESAGLDTVQTASELREALCEPGFTTRTAADQLHGRGQGLAAVEQAAAKLDGTLSINSRQDYGSSFILRLPLQVMVNQVVLVSLSGMLYAIPVNFVQAVADRAGAGQNLEFTDTGVFLDQVEFRFAHLKQLLGGNPSQVSAEGAQAVLVRVHEQHLALLVDEVPGFREIIAQPLGDQLARLHRYVGGSVLADGRQVLIPDLNRLVGQAGNVEVRLADTAKAKPTALVVDDSITMRVAAEQFLEANGIKASMARDGAEALELLKYQLPDVLLVDIDMPRLNGFDFLRHLRLLHPQHDTPVIMISTRTAAADRLEARRLGAGQYLRKPYTSEQLSQALRDAGVLQTP